TEGGVAETVVDGVTGRVVDREAGARAQAIAALAGRPRPAAEGVRAEVSAYWSWDAAADRFMAIVDGALRPVTSGDGRSVAAVSRGVAASLAARSIDPCA